jgi:membrane-associated phospholipid phosphatase
VGSILKVTVQRERPDHSDFYSFPSGHTYSIAATAMSLQEFYGWRVGVPAFLLTALTAASRWSADKHWLSDTVAGAALGVYFGHAFSQAHLKRIGLEGDSQSVSETVPERRHLGFSWHIYPLPVDGGGELLALISL